MELTNPGMAEKTLKPRTLMYELAYTSMPTVEGTDHCLPSGTADAGALQPVVQNGWVTFARLFLALRAFVARRCMKPRSA